MTDASDSNSSESLDGDALGEKPGDDGLPGIANFPPERPLGVEDPSILAGGSETEDDLITREWRENDEPTDEEGLRLGATDDGTLVGDDEKQAIADSATSTETPTAEEAAMHIEAPADRGVIEPPPENL